ncbi:MAG: pilin [Patescibacteria group bacterium]
MFSKFLSKTGPIVFLVITAGFYFGNVRVANAQLPVEAGLGEACDTATPCEDQFFCSGGVCVECKSEADCDDILSESCMEGVCTLPAGNNAGDLCAKDSNCKSGLKCGPNKTCIEGGGWKKAFGFTCKDNGDCASGLLCLPSGEGKKCLQCLGPANCPAEYGEVLACDEGVCAYKGGNKDGAWCTKDEHCASEKCSDGNLCQAAVGPPPDEWDWMGIDLTIEDVEDIINGLACWLTRIATAIMVIFLVLAGLRFMHARGNPTAYQSAVKNFQHVLIGILVIMAVYVIIATVAHAVGRTDFSLIPLIC